MKLDINRLAGALGGIAVSTARPHSIAPFKKAKSVFDKKFNSVGLKQLAQVTRIGIKAAESEASRVPAQNKEFMNFMKSIWDARRMKSGSADTVPEGEASFNDIADVFSDAYTKADLAKPLEGFEDEDIHRPGRKPHYAFLKGN